MGIDKERTGNDTVRPIWKRNKQMSKQSRRRGNKEQLSIGQREKSTEWTIKMEKRSETETSIYSSMGQGDPG